MTALIDTPHSHGDGEVFVSSYPPRRRRTLKDRIKRNMASSATSATSSSYSYSAGSPFVSGVITSGVSGSGNDPREELVLAAASTLASLGVTSPTSSFNSPGVMSFSGGDELRNDEHPTNATGSASVARSTPTDVTLLSGRMLMPSWIRPPPIVAPPSQLEVVETESRLSRLSRPFASLGGSGIPLTFPQTLMEVLSNPEISDIVTWLPHGKGFIILHKHKFSVDIMPGYFKQSKFTSFTRKLNRWGFSRVCRGPEMGAYYHKFFQRGNYLLCMQMHCRSNNKSTKDTTTMDNTASSSPATSPKHDPKVSSSPPPIKTSSNVISNTMSHLELDTKSSSPLPHLSPSPAEAVPNNNSDPAPTLPMNTTRRSAPLYNMQHHPSDISNNNAISNSNASSFVVKPSIRAAGHAYGRNLGQISIWPSPGAAARHC